MGGNTCYITIDSFKESPYRNIRINMSHNLQGAHPDKDPHNTGHRYIFRFPIFKRKRWKHNFKELYLLLYNNKYVENMFFTFLYKIVAIKMECKSNRIFPIIVISGT